MISNKQVKANQKNAKKGGVKTKKGKKISRYNAYNHGITANRLFSDEENEKYDFILHLLKEEFQISGYIEEILVERIAFYYTKIQKANKIEEKNTYIETLEKNSKQHRLFREMELNGESLPAEVKEVIFSLTHILDPCNIDDILKIQRYTSTAENRMYKAIKELIKIKQLKDPNFHTINIHF